jgi:hypothetical protein
MRELTDPKERKAFMKTFENDTMIFTKREGNRLFFVAKNHRSKTMDYEVGDEDLKVILDNFNIGDHVPMKNIRVS